MKNKVRFLKGCGAGSIVVLILLIGTLLIRNSRGLEGYINPLAIIAPLLFIPLLVSVFHDGRYGCKSEAPLKVESKKNKNVFLSRNRCVSIVGLLLLMTLIVSMIVLYYSW
jgi:hypothetical protein